MEVIKIGKLKDAKDFIRESLREQRLYSKTGEVIYLRQASEKLWVAYGLILEDISKTEIRSHSGVWLVAKTLSVSKKDRSFISLYDLVEDLHEYFYEGRIRSQRIVQKLDKARKMLNSLKKKYSI